ncbi:MAG: glycosyltransferase family 2 protein, partial [Clostridia bacterium]|nr:glycosyltransferase family 2 protein [Clostridia bacterium]
MDLISVIVPVYNAHKTLHRCLGSILNQTHKNIEVITVDDASQDDSLSILHDYAKKDSRV